MTRTPWKSAAASALIVVALTLAAVAQGGQPASPAPAAEPVPVDLRPLLAPVQSEMRLVVLRYAADRSLLAGNYQGIVEGGRGGGRGRGDGRATAAGPEAGASLQPAPPPPSSLSPGRIARLKRFDLDWQAALGKLDTAELSASARTDVEALNGTIAKNLAQLDADAALIGRLAPLVPFAGEIIDLYEARVRMTDIDAQPAAGVLNEVRKEIEKTQAALAAGLGDAGGATSLRAGRDDALKGADAVDGLRTNLTNWFNFYNGYDPQFTWWMGLPFKHVDTGLSGYAAFLRDKVAPAGQQGSPSPAAPAIAPAPASKFPSVPDLAEMLALPQDEMIPIVQRFTGRGGGRGGPAPARDVKEYRAWLDALKTLDFTKLSRNAQVDYLFIRHTSDKMIARAAVAPQKDIPRKTDTTGITGDARGRVGLMHDLNDVLVDYTPDELIELGLSELAWCEREIRKAAAQMGFGDDWKKAIEKVKTMHPPPGGQPAAIRDMLFEAVDYLRAHDLITVPQVAVESLRMSMMSPARQLINPFFTGGSQITVSYPTPEMEYEARLQSMRGNNVPFSHATAFHEMIPGHNLVGYLGSRNSGYRAGLGGGPFFGEGWPLYWEIILYDRGFHDTPEEKVGALFWRMHRAARVIFSMNFHLGIWSPQECIDFLVDRVGHERDNATAEVRRSFQQAAPLYQAAYLLGGLQLRALRREVVETGQMPEKAFHDEVMRQGSMPISLLRLAVSRQRLDPQMSIEWKFYRPPSR